MFDIGPAEFLLLLVLAVILFGPERLPELARKAARIVRYVRTHGRQRAAATQGRTRARVLRPRYAGTCTLGPSSANICLDDVEPIVADVKNGRGFRSDVPPPPSPGEPQKELSPADRHDLGRRDAVVAGAAPFDSDAT